VGDVHHASQGKRGARRLSRADQSAPVSWMPRKSLSQHPRLDRGATKPPSRTVGRESSGRRAALAWLAVLVIGAFIASWAKDHSGLWQSAWHAFRVYLTAWDIDIEHGFGMLEDVKFMLAVGLPLLIMTFLLSAAWAVLAALVSVTRRQMKRVLSRRDDRS
jgi:hypothetical protein